MRRIIALAVLLGCVGCSTTSKTDGVPSNSFLFQPASTFFSTEKMGGDPLPASTGSEK